MEKIWFEDHPAKFLLAPLLYPLSKVFGVIANHKRKQFVSQSNHAYRSPIPVIVVGNLSVGGNGKTPMVIWLVEQLQAQGMKPGVISRGYGAKAKQYPLLVEKATSTKQAGDEPVLIFQRTNAPVCVSPNRQQAIKELLNHGVNIIISDDGLQHYKMARDLEIVVIDGVRRFGNGHYLPFGPLRELPDRLASVDIKICNGDKANANEKQMRLEARDFINVATGEKANADDVQSAIAIAGIGNPKRFFTTLSQMGVTTSQEIAFADHQDFQISQLTEFANSTNAILMTEKDAVKCRSFAIENEIKHWWYLPVDAKFTTEESQEILDKINQIRKSYGS